MRQGYSGYNAGCCCPFEVWGISCYAPNIWPFLRDQAAATSGEVFLTEGSEENPPAPVIPTVVPFATSYAVSAARVPSSYPYSACNPRPVESSADPGVGCEDAWVVPITTAFTRNEYTHTVNGVPQTYYRYDTIGAVYSSRAICVDSEQKYVTYAVACLKNYAVNVMETRRDFFQNNQLVKDHVQIDIATATLAHPKFDSQNIGIDMNAQGTKYMQKAWIVGATIGTVVANQDGSLNAGFTLDSQSTITPKAVCVYYGKDYYVASSYRPGADNGTWAVGRLPYADLAAVHCTGESLFYGVQGFIGDYPICLPSTRAFLLSTVDQPDEPWVVAISATTDGYSVTAGNKIVTGRWLNTTMRGDPDPLLDFADGTLQEDEVENVIVWGDVGHRPAEYPDEAFDDVRLYCYNHINGKDYVLFSTAGTPTLESPLATFGVDSGAGNLNEGLPDGLEFTSVGDHGDQWAPSNQSYYSNPPDYTNFDTTKWACKANSSPAYIGEVSLKITVQVTDPNTAISFDYRLDNRALAEFFPHPKINQPATDGQGNYDTLELWDNGVKVWECDNTGRDPVAATFLEFDTATVNIVAAGDHVFRWVLKRYTSLNDLAAWIDNVQFPEILVGDDTVGRKYWLYDGTKVQKVKHWAWPVVNEEDNDSLYSRPSRAPTFITANFDGTIYYGNPHYVVCLKSDGTLNTEWGQKDTGMIRFSASKNIQPPPGYFDGDCEWVQILKWGPYDVTCDPPTGAFQILPTKDGIQLRAVNGHVRDATHLPFSLKSTEHNKLALVTNAASPFWNMRVTGWTITDNGKTIVPHLEILPAVWKEIESFPVPRPEDGYPIPPFYDYIEHSGDDIFNSNISHGSPQWDRPRNPEIVNEASLKSTWSSYTKVLPRVYSDVGSHVPHYQWLHNPAPPPEETINNGQDPNPEYYTYPWPEGQYACWTAWFNPTQDYIRNGIWSILRPQTDPCPQGDPPHYKFIWDTEPWSGGFPDFDAVYNSFSANACCSIPNDWDKDLETNSTTRVTHTYTPGTYTLSLEGVTNLRILIRSADQSGPTGGQGGFINAFTAIPQFLGDTELAITVNAADTKNLTGIVWNNSQKKLRVADGGNPNSGDGGHLVTDDLNLVKDQTPGEDYFINDSGIDGYILIIYNQAVVP